MKYFLSLYILSLIIVACHAPETTDATDHLFIPADIFENPEPIALSTIAESSRYLVIDTTGGYYIKSIYGLCNYGANYLIFDDQGVFYTITPQGQVLSTFRHQGKGPGEYLNIDDIAINPSNLDIYVNSTRLRKIIHYDSTGKLLHELPVRDYYINNLTFKNNHLLGVSSFPMFLNNEHSPQFIFIYDQNLNLVATKDHPTWTENKPGFQQATILPMRTFDMGQYLVFYEMYQNGRFYKINSQDHWNIEEWLHIQLENNLSDQQMLNSGDDTNNQDLFNGYNYIQTVVATPRYIFLNIDIESIFNPKTVLVDRKKKTITGVQDFAGYNRLRDDINGFFSFWPLGYLPGTNEAYDFSYAPGKMEQEYREAIEIAPDSMKRADSSVLNLFDAAKRMGNPVIQLVELK